LSGSIPEIEDSAKLIRYTHLLIPLLLSGCIREIEDSAKLIPYGHFLTHFLLNSF